MKQILLVCLFFPIIGITQDCLSKIDSFDINDYELYPYFYHYQKVKGTDCKIFDFYNRLVDLANEGDEKAENYYLKYLTDMYYATKKAHISSNFFSGTMTVTIEKLRPSKALFETLLIFFEDSRRYSDELKQRWDKQKIKVNRTQDTHYGMYIYDNYLTQMMEAEQRKEYGKLYYSILDEMRAKYIADKKLQIKYLEKDFHPIWYKRIKEDWEAGKIKLRESK